MIPARWVLDDPEQGEQIGDLRCVEQAPQTDHLMGHPAQPFNEADRFNESKIHLNGW